MPRVRTSGGMRASTKHCCHGPGDPNLHPAYVAAGTGLSSTAPPHHIPRLRETCSIISSQLGGSGCSGRQCLLRRWVPIQIWPRCRVLYSTLRLCWSLNLVMLTGTGTMAMRAQHARSHQLGAVLYLLPCLPMPSMPSMHRSGQDRLRMSLQASSRMNIHR